MAWKETSFYPKEKQKRLWKRDPGDPATCHFLCAPNILRPLRPTLGRRQVCPTLESQGLFVVTLNWQWMTEDLRTGQAWPHSVHRTPETLLNKMLSLLVQKLFCLHRITFLKHEATYRALLISNSQDVSGQCGFLLTPLFPALLPLGSTTQHYPHIWGSGNSVLGG